MVHRPNDFSFCHVRSDHNVVAYSGRSGPLNFYAKLTLPGAPPVNRDDAAAPSVVDLVGSGRSTWEGQAFGFPFS